MSFIEDHNSFVDAIKKLIEDKDYIRASTLLKNKLVKEPEVSVFQLFYFEVLIQLHKYKEAKLWLKKFIAKCKSQTDVYYYEGLYYFLEDNLNQSMESLGKCFKRKVYYLKKLSTDDTFDLLKETKEFKKLIKPAKVFQVNEFISLKLIFSKTLIYVCGDLFLTCQKVALNLAPNEFEKYDNFDDIDGAVDFYESKASKEEVIITPEEEFWVHCSNLQTWVENKYNTNILTKYLSFPILEELSQRGISYFVTIFKEEIISRIKTGGIKILLYFIEGDYLNYLSEEDFFDSLLSIEDAEIIRNISNLIPLR
ncbi:hypothetical protein LCGC14_3025040, partial [marine sediment metagenome]